MLQSSPHLPVDSINNVSECTCHASMRGNDIMSKGFWKIARPRGSKTTSARCFLHNGCLRAENHKCVVEKEKVLCEDRHLPLVRSACYAHGACSKDKKYMFFFSRLHSEGSGVFPRALLMPATQATCALRAKKETATLMQTNWHQPQVRGACSKTSVKWFN